MTLFGNIKLLPKDIINFEILPFISSEILLFTCKKYYENNIIKYRLTNNNFSYKKNGLILDSYIKKIIMKGFDYIFQLLINEKYYHWKKIKRYRYKAYLFDTYVDVLNYLCIELDSTKCRILLMSYEKKNDVVRKNKYKKMRRINNKWSN